MWDIGTVYQPDDKPDMLVRSLRLGASLAQQFSAPENASVTIANPDHKVVLMRKHGFTTLGTSIRSAVFRAVYTTTNARVQTSTALLRHAFGGSGGDMSAWAANDKVIMGDFEPLTAEQAAAAEASNNGTIDRPWILWEAEVESQPLYVNKG